LRMQRGGGDFYSKIDLTVGNNGFGFELVKMCCNFCNVIWAGSCHCHVWYNGVFFFFLTLINKVKVWGMLILLNNHKHVILDYLNICISKMIFFKIKMHRCIWQELMMLMQLDFLHRNKFFFFFWKKSFACETKCCGSMFSCYDVFFLLLLLTWVFGLIYLYLD
jgi:hypothetical protein